MFVNRGMGMLGCRYEDLEDSKRRRDTLVPRRQRRRSKQAGSGVPAPRVAMRPHDSLQSGSSCHCRTDVPTRLNRLDGGDLIHGSEADEYIDHFGERARVAAKERGDLPPFYVPAVMRVG
jgi:hypothetical protein